MLFIGYHSGTSEGILNSLKDAVLFGANSVQIFIGNPKTYYAKILSPEICKPIKEYVEKHNLFLICHSPYILNFARPPKTQEKSRERYITDLINIYNLGGIGSVLHMGYNVKELKQTCDDACNNFIQNLELICKDKRLNPKITIILENMAGKGTAMCCEMKEWNAFNNMIKHLPIKWCIDTAHLFATGEYNISKKREVDRFYSQFNDWDSVLCFHYNGSALPFGCKKDLHADIIGNNLILSKGMKRLARLAFVTDKPMIMEVPGNIPIYIQIKIVKEWCTPNKRK